MVERKLGIPVYAEREGARAPRAQAQESGGQYVAHRVAQDEANSVARLKEECRQHERYLMWGLRRSGIAAPAGGPQSRRAQLTGMQRGYMGLMAASCLVPFRRGMRAETVIEAFGMGAAMWLCSPNFRDALGGGFVEMHRGITDQIARLGGAKARSKEAQAIQRGGGREDLSRKWLRRLDRIERLERHGLEPLTPRAAGLMEVGIAESAYEEMRAPGADPEAVGKAHKEALGELYSMAKADGIEPGEVSRQMRGIVEARVAAEPEFAARFGGLSHGAMALGKDGRAVDARTGAAVDRGSFLVRAPMGEDEHREEMAATFYAEMAAAGKHGPRALDTQMRRLLLGSVVGSHPISAETAGDTASQLVLGQCRSMFESMRDDGLALEQARVAYAGAFRDAAAALGKDFPNAVRQWKGEYGENWDATFMRQLRSAEDILAQEKNLADRAAQRGEAEGVRATIEPERAGDGVAAHGYRPGLFAKRGAVPGGNYHEHEDSLLERMASYMGNDIAQCARAGDDTPARIVYRSPEASLEPDDDGALQLFPDDEDARLRTMAMRTMREEMQQLGMPQARQDEMFAAAYVRGLEKAMLADPAYEREARRLAELSEGDWQEVQFARTMALTHTGHTGGAYRSLVTGHGMDPGILHDAAEEDAASFAQLHEEQARFGQSLSVPGTLDTAPAGAERSLQDGAGRGALLQRAGREINQEFNAEGDDAKILDPDADTAYELAN